jgi:hypothetical protein
MSITVFGRTPVSEQGYQFRSNVWEWHPLWQYCEEIAPDIIPSDNPGHGNGGWGLDEYAALFLAERLDEALASGDTRRHEEDYRARLAALPPEPCMLCGGTGRRAQPLRANPGSLLCKVCGGTGLVANSETNLSFSTGNVREFVTFLWHCGGFYIH